MVRKKSKFCTQFEGIRQVSIHSFMSLDITVKMCNYTLLFSLIMDQINVDYFGLLLTVIVSYQRQL